MKIQQNRDVAQDVLAGSSDFRIKTEEENQNMHQVMSSRGFAAIPGEALLLDIVACSKGAWQD